MLGKLVVGIIEGKHSSRSKYSDMENISSTTKGLVS